MNKGQSNISAFSEIESKLEKLLRSDMEKWLQAK
ncbi:hypothetical protein [Streptococcus sp. HF-1907]|nr:hypothetical protein [Streptococcus sp. HF-1907]